MVGTCAVDILAGAAPDVSAADDESERNALVGAAFDLFGHLSGEVEIDDSLVGGVFKCFARQF